MEDKGDLVQSKKDMRIRNNICTNGKPVMEFIPESPEDEQQIYAMMLDGTMPDSASQSVPIGRTQEEIENGAWEK